MSESFIQILYEQYRTEYCGPWHTRECYPWEYDVKAHECIQLASNSNSQSWFLQQAKILQDRARYIRQLATQQATQLATQQATQLATQQVTQLVTQQATQQATPPTPKQQVFQPPEQEQEQEQEEKIAENNAENIAEKPTATDSSSTVNKSLLPIILHQTIKQFDREPASHDGSNNFHGCNSFRLRFLPEHYHYALLVSRPDYIEHAKEMEATGQG